VIVTFAVAMSGLTSSRPIPKWAQHGINGPLGKKRETL